MVILYAELVDKYKELYPSPNRFSHISKLNDVQMTSQTDKSTEFANLLILYF